MDSNPISLGHITNADIYLDDKRMVGRVKEFNLGEMAYKMVTHEALGMIGVMDLPSRAMDSLKATITFEYYEPELVTALYNPTKACRFFLHAYLDKFNTDGLADGSARLVTMVKTFPSKMGERGHKLGENSEQTFECTISAMTQKLSISSQPLFEYDLFAGIHKVNGADVWPS